MGEGQNGLVDLLDLAAAHLRGDQRQDDRHRKFKENPL